MNAPTPKAMEAWSKQFDWRSNPPTICAYCGAIGTMAYIQPLHPWFVENSPEYALPNGSPFIGTDGHAYHCCHGPCEERRAAARKERRKAQLAKLDRCEACSSRGTWRFDGHLLCGRHKKQVLAKVSAAIAGSGLAGLAMFGDIGQSELLNSEINEMVSK